MVSGCSGTGATFPPNSRRNRRSGRPGRSIVATWTSSWFMMTFIRSLPAMVSNAKLNGEICTSTVSYGTTPAPAFPASEKSASSTVIGEAG